MLLSSSEIAMGNRQMASGWVRWLLMGRIMLDSSTERLTRRKDMSITLE